MAINPFFTFTERIRHVDAMPLGVCVYTLLPDLGRLQASLPTALQKSKPCSIVATIVVRTSDRMKLYTAKVISLPRAGDADDQGTISRTQGNCPALI